VGARETDATLTEDIVIAAADRDAVIELLAQQLADHHIDTARSAIESARHGFRLLERRRWVRPLAR
jgi:hypothetical protein